MKRYLRVAQIAGFHGLLAISPWAMGANDIRVHLMPHSVVKERSSGVMTVTVTNASHATVYIPKALSPFYTPDNHLTTKLFRITDASGSEVHFTGRYMRIIPEDPAWYYLALEPGQSIVRDIDLSADYDLSAGGEFAVSYDQSYATIVHTDARGQIDSPYASQPSDVATVWISP